METLYQILTRIQTDAASALSQLPPPPTETITLVRAGESLQAALDAGGNLQLEAGATFVGSFVASKPGTRVNGADAFIRSENPAPALRFPPGAYDIQVSLKEARTIWDQSCVQIGDNTITNEADLPTAIIVSVTVPTHRGKRAFEVSGGHIALLDCNAYDVWDTYHRDSQGVLILNSPGDVRIIGGTFEAGSENILVGGARTGVVNIQPKNILIEDVVLRKPLSWRTDGVNRAVKNLFELKSGVGVILRRAKLSGNWVAGQAGWAVVLTPRDGKTVSDVLIEDVTLRDTVHAVNLLGYDDAAVSGQTSNIVFRRFDAVSEQRGFQWAHPLRNLTLDSCKWDGPNNTVYAFAGNVWDAAGNVASVPQSTGVRIINNTFAARGYGIMLNGAAYARNWKTVFPDGEISGNTLVGVPAAALTATQNNLPGNTIVPA